MRENGSDISVLGAGIMGCCLALELSYRGYKVDLVDCAPKPMTSTSLHNEGKLHLGFVYANDPLGETHGLMIRASFAFSNIIERLTGEGADSFGRSRPFHYFVPIDSQMGMSAIKEHFQKVEKEIQEICNNSEDRYLDLEPECYYQQNSPEIHRRLFSSDFTRGSFRTEERSVSTVAVANILHKAVIKDSNINFIGNTAVISAKRLSSGDIDVEFQYNGNKYTEIYPCVANCLWDDKLRIDDTVGVSNNGSWLFRYKATINISLPSTDDTKIPSATGILGPYGDVVHHSNNSYYLSWYPLCKLVQSTDSDGRELHERVHKEPLSQFVKIVKSTHPSIAHLLSSFTHKRFIKRNIREMSRYIPALASIVDSKKKVTLGGGVILAKGATDIDDPSSYLHQRSKVGPVAHGSYVTIDTGKYCTAPLFALEAADMVVDILE